MEQEKRDRIVRSIKRNLGSPNGVIAHNTNCLVAEVAQVREDLGIAEPEAPPSRSRSRKGKTLGQFRDRYDVDLIIQKKVDEVLSDKDEEYYDDHDFREMCGIATQNWRRHADSSRFQPYRLKKGDLNVWGPAHIIISMRRILGLPVSSHE